MSGFSQALPALLLVPSTSSHGSVRIFLLPQIYLTSALHIIFTYVLFKSKKLLNSNTQNFFVFVFVLAFCGTGV
jgi:hypothetical protein